MRERSGPVREARTGAVGEAPAAGLARFWLRAMGLAVAVGVFLAFVGAFGTDALPALPRYALFVVISIVTMATAAGVVEPLRRAPVLCERRWLLQAVIVAVLTPLTALEVWALIGFAFLGGPKAAAFPAYLASAFGMTVAMSTLSQLLFRRGQAAEATPAAAPDAAPAAVRFLERVPPSLKGADIYAVQAEDHYVRLHTSKGTALILLRLADAAAELEGLEGARVHRSWWVARAAVAGTARRGAQTVLKLRNGVEAPVSRREAAELRRAGWF